MPEFSGPGRKSVYWADSNPHYRHVDGWDVHGAVFVVYEHVSTGTFWKGWYSIGLDENGSREEVTWVRVYPVERVVRDWSTERG
jgi:hypothetical protein